MKKILFLSILILIPRVSLAQSSNSIHLDSLVSNSDKDSLINVLEKKIQSLELEILKDSVSSISEFELTRDGIKLKGFPIWVVILAGVVAVLLIIAFIFFRSNDSEGGVTITSIIGIVVFLFLGFFLGNYSTRSKINNNLSSNSLIKVIESFQNNKEAIQSIENRVTDLNTTSNNNFAELNSSIQILLNSIDDVDTKLQTINESESANIELKKEIILWVFILLFIIVAIWVVKIIIDYRLRSDSMYKNVIKRIKVDSKRLGFDDNEFLHYLWKLEEKNFFRDLR